MRKFLALAAAVVLLTGMVSCGQQGGAQPAPAATTAAQTAQAATTAAQTAQAETGASGNPGGAKSDVMKVAMITGIGDINDQSFNQTTYEACKAYCDLNGLDFTYSRPDEETTEGRAKAIGKAVEEGYNVIVLPGYSFAGCLLETTEKYPDVKFIALDVSDDDILREALGDKYDGRPGYWNAADYYYEDNVYCAVYQEEIAGYMAGMAAVKMGYKKLGFLGGVAVPAVIRYGSGRAPMPRLPSWDWRTWKWSTPTGTSSSGTRRSPPTWTSGTRTAWNASLPAAAGSEAPRARPRRRPEES